MSTEILMKDDLRAQVEKESGGRQTVIYTFKGQPSYFSVIPRVNLEDLHPGLGTGPHPAFLVDGVVKEQIFVASYQAVIRDGEAVSLPGEVPATNVTFDQARAACEAAGPGFHLLNNWEWAYLALSAAANGHDVRGNTKYGASHTHPNERGTKTRGSEKVLTGSGPAAWRHDGTMFGVSDLVGNVWEWTDGLKLVSGKIMMPRGNDFALPEAEWPAIGVCMDLIQGCPTLSSEVTKRGWNGRHFREVAAASGFEVPAALKQALLYPCLAADLPGYYWADNNDGFEAMPIRGGYRGSESAAGLAALDLSFQRGIASSGIGFRPAFIG